MWNEKPFDPFDSQSLAQGSQGSSQSLAQGKCGMRNGRRCPSPAGNQVVGRSPLCGLRANGGPFVPSPRGSLSSLRTPLTLSLSPLRRGRVLGIAGRHILWGRYGTAPHPHRPFHLRLPSPRQGGERVSGLCGESHSWRHCFRRGEGYLAKAGYRICGGVAYGGARGIGLKQGSTFMDALFSAEWGRLSTAPSEHRVPSNRASFPVAGIEPGFRRQF